MSLKKYVDLRCDLCEAVLPSEHEMVANSHGITKGNLTTDLRAMAKQLGWTKRRTIKNFPIDVCPDCRKRKTPKVLWFERSNGISPKPAKQPKDQEDRAEDQPGG